MITLICIGEGKKYKRYQFNKKIVSIGRGAENDIVLTDSRVSRAHCLISEEEDGYIFKDLNSKNGIFVNKKKIKEEKIYFGDILGVGKYILKLMTQTPTQKSNINKDVDSSIEILSARDLAISQKSPYYPLGPETEDYFREKDAETVRSEYQRLWKSYRNLIILFNLSNALIRITLRDELMENLGETLLTGFNDAERCAIFTFPEDGTDLELVKMRSNLELVESEQTLPLDLIKQSATKRKSLNAVDIGELNSYFDDSKSGQRRIRSMMIAPMFVKDKNIGALYVENWTRPYCFDEFDLELLCSFANQIAIAFNNNLLYEKLDHAYETAYSNFLAEYQEKTKAMDEIRKQQVMLEKLSSEIIIAEEKERKRVSIELHDGIGQILSALKINLELTKKQGENKYPGMALEIDESLKLVSRAMEDLRRIARDLRPSMLDDFGLIPTIQWYINEYEKLTGIKVDLNISIPNTNIFTPDQEINLFRIIQESLTNIIKHSKAKEASLDLDISDEKVRLVIEDNGIGFSPVEKLHNNVQKCSFGILNMNERAKMLGGDFEILSQPGAGTKITIKFPILINQSNPADAQKPNL